MNEDSKKEKFMESFHKLKQSGKKQLPWKML